MRMRRLRDVSLLRMRYTCIRGRTRTKEPSFAIFTILQNDSMVAVVSGLSGRCYMLRRQEEEERP